MSDRKIKTTTLKRLSRKVRGIENLMWAVIGTVLVVVVAFVMWNIFSGVASTITAPQVQLVPQESYIIGDTAYVTLKFGRGFKGVSVSLAVPQGKDTVNLKQITNEGCSPSNTNVAEGQKVTFQCKLQESPSGVVYYVNATWAGGKALIKWVVG